MSKAEVAEEPTGIEAWSQTQYYAWVMFGSMAAMQAYYWLQHFYYKFWMSDSSDYLAGSGKLFYAKFGFAESISVLILVVQWVVTTALWCLTALNIDWLTHLFLAFVSLTHYLDAGRLVWLVAVRTWGMIVDTPTSYYTYNGWAHTGKVSKPHFLGYWDFMMEFMALTVGFGFYPDLKSIKYIAAHQQVKKDKAAAKAAEEKEGGDEESTEDTLEI